jgi:uncharacterized protein YceK
MGPKATACLVAVLACALGGCGTVVNCISCNGVAAREIYGGVKQDAQNGTLHLNEALHGPAPTFGAMPKPPDLGRDFVVKSFCAGCGIGMLAVDLPVSAVADTLTLPITVPATLMKQKKRKPNHRPKVMGMPAAAVPSKSSSAP